MPRSQQTIRTSRTPEQTNPHTDLVHAILHALGADPRWRLWKQNTGSARTARGAHVRFGIPGQADISGILIGTGRRIEVEIKTGSGRQSAAQRNWQAMIERFGGLYVLARSVDDVRRALESSAHASR